MSTDISTILQVRGATKEDPWGLWRHPGGICHICVHRYTFLLNPGPYALPKAECY